MASVCGNGLGVRLEPRGLAPLPALERPPRRDRGQREDAGDPGAREPIASGSKRAAMPGSECDEPLRRSVLAGLQVGVHLVVGRVQLLGVAPSRRAAAAEAMFVSIDSCHSPCG